METNEKIEALKALSATLEVLVGLSGPDIQSLVDEIVNKIYEIVRSL